MGPGSVKRKRQDRQFSQDESRPSPHRPESLGMAHHGGQQRFDGRGRGDHRRGRGGHAGHGGHSGHPTNISADDRRPRPPLSQDPTSSPSTPAPASPAVTHQRLQPPTPVNNPPPRFAPPRATPASREPSPPLDHSLPVDYDYFTQDLVTTWNEGGKEKCRENILAQCDALAEGLWIQELVRSAIYKRLDPAVAGSFFAEINEARKSASADLKTEDVFVDAVSLLPPADWKRTAFSKLVFSSGVPAETWRMVLESDCVEALGMSRERFSRKKAVKITNYLYRQSNYNLLREESEGYAKLVTEYFNIAQNASALDSPPTIALDAFERVKALIGSFDLDVGRVLDISLDVFANLLVRNFRFFVKFIRASSWWPALDCPDLVKWEGQGFESLPEWALPTSRDWGIGQEESDRLARLAPLIEARDIKFWQTVKDQGMAAFYEIGSKHIMNFEDEAVTQLLSTEIQPSKDDVDGKGVEKNKIKRLRTNDRRKWMLSTKTLPPSGNPEAANLLGFKLSFYSSPARDATDVMPDNLIYLSALLIKVGFISLRDLYPHLYPLDEKMDDVKAKLEEELREREYANRPGGGPNKLALSGALPDDMPPALPALKNLKDTANSSKASSPKPETTPKAAAESQEELPEPPNQKIMLLKSLLAIGALPEALFILGRFPWLADLLPDLPEYIHRILHHMLSKVYEPTRPLNFRGDLSTPQNHVGDSAGLPKGSLRQVPTPSKPAKRWAQLDKPDDGDGIAFKFYWDDWTQNIPVCQTVDDVFLLCATFLNFSGVKIGQDPALLVKLARIGKRSLQEDRSSENESRWIDLLKRLLVPALSMTSKNPGTANEIYDLLRLFPTSTRYSIYAEWHFGPTARLPDVKRAFERTRLEARDVLKRISKTNVRPMGKALAKVAYGSPGIVLQTAINQMESYENLIEVFVECSRYFTFLGYDVLTWCLLNALGGGSRSRIQDDGMLTSSWLRALSTFAGAIYKRYAMCDPTPVLHYIASELRNGQSTDLELLEQMVVAMIGIKSDMAYNDAQILAMAGGDLLQAQTLKQMADERHKNEKSGKRLVKALADSGLAGQILIAVAQERQLYSSRDSCKNAPLKVLGNNIDKIHQVLVQYLEALRNGSTIEHFAELVPEPLALMTEFGLDVEVAFMIGRAGISKQIAEIDARRKAEMLEKTRAQHTGQQEENGDVNMADAQPTFDGQTVKAEAGSPQDAEMKESISDQAVALSVDATDAQEDPIIKVTDAAANVWHPALVHFIERLPLILGEEMTATISIPFYVTFWTLGLQDILVNNTAYDQELAHQTSLANQIKNDRSDPSVAGQKERERKLKAINDLKESLGKEMRSQIGAYTQVRNRLGKEKDRWFGDFHQKIATLHNSLLQNCFIPRMLFSPLDAQFTFTMVKFLHNNGTPGFRTMHLFDLFFKKVQLASLVFSVTAREAENLGRFISESMKEFMIWHGDQSIYEKNAYGNKRQLPGFARKLDETHAPVDFLGFEEFRHLLYKWHSCLTNALKSCLESDEYMHIRNAIIVLKAMPPHFPVVNFMVTDLVKKVTDLSQSETRGDLKLAATSLLGNLKPQEKNVWLPNEFKFANGKRGQAKASPSAGATTQASPKPTTGALNAEAPEFKPSAGANGSHDAEDGEIHDDKKEVDVRADAMEIDGKPSGPLKSGVHAVKQANSARAPSPARAQTPKPYAQSPAPTPGTAGRTEANNRGTPSSRDIKSDHRLPQRPDFGRNSHDRVQPRESPRVVSNYGRLDRPDDLEQSSSRPGAYNDRRDAGKFVVDERARRDGWNDQDPRGPAREPRAETPRTPRDAPLPARPTANSRSQRDPPVNGTVSLATGPAAASPRDVVVNPARLALIEDAQRPTPEQHRQRSDDGRDRASRNSSPRRETRPSLEARAGQSSAPAGPANSMNDRRVDLAPSGPRQDRHHQDTVPSKPSADLFDNRATQRSHQDPTYGRLNTQGPQQAYRKVDPSFGRLDRPTDAPAGPKSAVPGGPRGAPTGPQSRTPGTSPTMPSQGWQQQPRMDTRGRPATGSAPATPSHEPEGPLLSGVHPSRRGRLDPADAGQQSDRPQSSMPMNAGPSGKGAASGPAADSARNDRRFAGLNQALQGSAGQGTPVKGRAGRVNGNAGQEAASSPATQSMPPPQANARPSDLSRTGSMRSNRGSEQLPAAASRTPPRPGYDQSASSSRSAPRGGAYDPVKDDMSRRGDYRTSSMEVDPRSRAGPPRDDYRGYAAQDPREYREDPYGRGPPSASRSANPYPPDSRGYPAGPDAYANSHGSSRRPMDDGRAPPPMSGSSRSDYRGADGRSGYPSARADFRDDRGPPAAGRHDDRKRRADEMAPDPAKRRRSGG
ncbi:hypothetical protein K461DRAFT_310149 [Myriangium duriaei CBS 260.36]|uniref:THO complex subunit 2 n=1 Tax=Myriangium duriaei CBS 260.36 TaxID=1168546 RepID=A0A9P4JAB7_9PEZI|nr:hypothetical protein K461DRAFT_310149 [Myriangium duriaei CBS 260.36]